MRGTGFGIVVAVGTLLLVACGDDDGTATPDAGPMEDGATPPPPPRDMGPREDMGPRDMGPRDTGPLDMGPPAEPCDRAGVSEDLVCGMCGTQTRFCTSGLTWEYGDCEDERGVCMAGEMGSVDCGGMMVDARCTDACQWQPLDEMVVCPLPICTDPLRLMGRMGETVSIDLDTTTGPPGPLDLGPMCGGAVTDPTMRPPQVVVALAVPGTGTFAVDFTLINDGTSTAIDTVVQARTDCMVAPTGPGTGLPGMPAAGCFDDSPPPMGEPEFRSSGRFAATGGETVFLVVTAFHYGPTPPDGRLDRGPMRLDVTVGPPLAPPTLTMATVQANDTETTFTLVGGDPDGDAVSMRATFLDAAGMPVDFDGSGIVDALDDFTNPLPSEVTGMMTFSTMVFAPFLSMQLASSMARRARIVLVDATGATSAPLTVDIIAPVGFGEPCDAMSGCRAPFVCTMGTCQATPEATAACAAATVIPLMGTPATGTVMGTLLPGTGLFSGCASSAGTEALYRVTVPAGSWDLVASNQIASTPMGTDTVLYVRRTCIDPRTEAACNDDAGELRAVAVVLDAMPGEYTIVQERLGMTPPGMMTSYGLEVRLRPVLAAGAACDPMGVADRCATGPCPMMTPVCPPAS